MTNRPTYILPESPHDLGVYLRACGLVDLLAIRHEAKKFGNIEVEAVCNLVLREREKTNVNESLF